MLHLLKNQNIYIMFVYHHEVGLICAKAVNKTVGIMDPNMVKEITARGVEVVY